MGLEGSEGSLGMMKRIGGMKFKHDQTEGHPHETQRRSAGMKFRHDQTERDP